VHSVPAFLEKKSGNVYVTAIKSRTLQNEIYELFVNNVTDPNVKKNKLLLVLGSWGGQSDLALYDEKFIDEHDEPVCSPKVTPP
jgi:hypothetical protein